MPVIQLPARPSRRRRDAGFSVADVMISALILAFCIMTSLTVIQYGFRAMDNARNTTIAGQILQSMMEDTRMLPWTAASGTSISTLASGTVTPDSSFTAGDAAAQALVARFTITRTVSTVSTYIKEIDYNATWKGIDGRSHSLTYSGYYSQYGLNNYFVN
jgi:uncharacterized protein (TIGR02598 family)